MKLKKLNILFLLLAIAFTSVSCKKKCKIEAVNVDSGQIRENVVLYPSSGYMTANMAGNYVIDANSGYASRFEMSLNQEGRTAVDYANYSIIAFPVNAKCNASFDRNVTIDNVAQTVTYKMTVTQCDNCKEERFTENYVLVPSFPNTYNVVYDLTVVEK